MVQLKVSVLKTHGCQDDSEMEFTALAVGEPNASAVLRAAMAVTTFGPGRDASDDVEDEITLTLLSQRPMMHQDSQAKVQDRVGALETAVDDSVDHGLPPESAKMLRDIIFRTHLDVFRRALLGDPPAGVEPMTVRLQPAAKAVRAKPRASPPAKVAWLHEHMANLETAGMVFRNLRRSSKRGDGNSQGIQLLPHGHGLSGRQRNHRTGGYAHAKPEHKASLFAGATAWCTLAILEG